MGVSSLIFQPNTGIFMHGHLKPAIISYSSIETEKIFSQGGCFWGQKTHIFLYLKPSPGLIFQWIVLKISMHTHCQTLLGTKYQNFNFINKAMIFFSRIYREITIRFSCNIFLLNAIFCKGRGTMKKKLFLKLKKCGH